MKLSGQGMESRFEDDASETVKNSSLRKGRIIIWSVFMFFVAVLVWATYAEVDEVVRADGKVIPSRQIQIVQNLEGGIVSFIAVDEGDIVDQGQVLLELDETQFAAELEVGRTRYMEHKARAARLLAEAENGDYLAPEDVLAARPELVEQERELFIKRKRQYQRQQRSLQKELNMLRPLIKEGAVSELETLRLERKINDLRDEFRNEAREQLNETMGEIYKFQESNKTLEYRLRRTKVRAPLRGVVKRVMVNTIGGVIQPGVDLVEIVPLEDHLIIEARVLPADIAFLHPGLHTMVKFTAYDFSIYGGLPGSIQSISADTITDEDDYDYFLVNIRTDQGYLDYSGKKLPVIPGMAASVDIITGRKTILQYLLKPVMKVREQAFRER